MQTSYSIDMAVAQVGMLADTGMVKDVASLKNPAGAVFVGRVVTKGATADAIIHPVSAAGITNALLMRGIVLHAHEQESKADGLDPNWPAESVVPVLKKGRVWVKSIAAATEHTSSVHVYHVASTGKPLGAITGSQDSTDTAVLPGARFVTSTTGANQLAVVELK